MTAGVLLALLVADVLGLHWWSVGLVIFVSLAIGQILKLGRTGSRCRSAPCSS